MTLLIDTQAFIWFDADPARLSARAAQVLADPNNVVLLSVASVWEMVIKANSESSRSATRFRSW